MKIISISLFILHILLKLSIVESQQQQQDEVHQFWNSIDHLSKQSNKRFHLIANEISDIASSLNQTSSACYQLIENVLLNGVRQEWSAKSKKHFNL